MKNMTTLGWPKATLLIIMWIVVGIIAYITLNPYVIVVMVIMVAIVTDTGLANTDS